MAEPDGAVEAVAAAHRAHHWVIDEDRGRKYCACSHGTADIVNDRGDAAACLGGQQGAVDCLDHAIDGARCGCGFDTDL